MDTRLLVALATLCLGAASPAAAIAPAAAPTEYEVKAAFVVNFARFVEWPEAPAGPFVVGVLGEDPFGDALDHAFRGEVTGGHAWTVRRLARPEDGTGVQILFVGKSEEKRLAAILAQMRGAPVLTVSDMPGFAGRGGMIGFRLEERRVRFDIDPEPAAQAGLKLSSQLLKLARIVSGRAVR